MRYQVFCHTRTLFSAISERGDPRGVKVIFTTNRPGGWSLHAVPAAEASWSDYVTRYNPFFFLSIGPQPTDPDDSEFLTREADQLLAVEGGREVGKDIEETEIRIFAKISEAKPFMSSLTRRLDVECIRGVALRGRPYPRIRVEKSLLDGDVSLWTNLDSKAIEAIPVV